MATPRLDGFVVGITADRRWDEQAELLSRRGVSVVHGPTIRTLPLVSDPELLAVTERLVAEPPDILVANTAIGVRAWLSEAESHGLGDHLVKALQGSTVLARGPKAAGAVHAAGLHINWRAPSETLDELRDELFTGDVAGTRIAYQRDGGESHAVADELRAAGADVIEVPVYRWQLPEDVRPAERLVEATIEGRVHAVTFTSGPAVRNLLAIAGDMGLESDLLTALAGPVTAVTVGPVSAVTARRQGIAHTLTPSRARLGPMIRTLAEHLGSLVVTVDVDGVRLDVRGTVVEARGRCVDLTPKEIQLLRALAVRPGAVVSKSVLLQQVWGGTTDDPHLVEVTVARLRRRLDELDIAVATVARRGYRLTSLDPVAASSA